MEGRRRPFWKSILPRLWRRHRSEYSPRVREGYHPRIGRIGGPTSRSESNIVNNRQTLFAVLPQPKHRLGGWQPKCLPDIVYEDILSGQVEDASRNCWLEDHLHQFASIRRYRQQANHSGGCRDLRRVFHVGNSDQDSMDESNDDDNDDDDNDEEFSSPPYSAIDDGAFDMDVDLERVPAFVNHVVDSAYRAHMGLTLDEQPPPYYEDPPPSYEEAVRPRNRSSTNSGSVNVLDRSDILY